MLWLRMEGHYLVFRAILYGKRGAEAGEVVISLEASVLSVFANKEKTFSFSSQILRHI